MIRMEVEPTQSKTVAQKRGKCMTIEGTEIYAATAMKRKEHIGYGKMGSNVITSTLGQGPRGHLMLIASKSPLRATKTRPHTEPKFNFPNSQLSSPRPNVNTHLIHMQ